MDAFSCTKYSSRIAQNTAQNGYLGILEQGECWKPRPGGEELEGCENSDPRRVTAPC